MFIFPGKNGPIESVHMAEPSRGEIKDEDLLDEYPEISCIFHCPIKLLLLYVSGRYIN